MTNISGTTRNIFDFVIPTTEILFNTAGLLLGAEAGAEPGYLGA